MDFTGASIQASMEPQLLSCGNTCANPLSPTAWGFNGAAASQLRKQVEFGSEMELQTSFNGAAASQLRKLPGETR